MFHAQILWNKKRVKTETEKDGCKRTKNKDSTNIHYQLESGCKDTQTAKQILSI